MSAEPSREKSQKQPVLALGLTALLPLLALLGFLCWHDGGDRDDSLPAPCAALLERFYVAAQRPDFFVRLGRGDAAVGSFELGYWRVQWGSLGLGLPSAQRLPRNAEEVNAERAIVHDGYRDFYKQQQQQQGNRAAQRQRQELAQRCQQSDWLLD